MVGGEVAYWLVRGAHYSASALDSADRTIRVRARALAGALRCALG